MLITFIPVLLRYNWCIIWSYLEHWKQSAKNKSFKSINKYTLLNWFHIFKICVYYLLFCLTVFKSEFSHLFLVNLHLWYKAEMKDLCWDGYIGCTLLICKTVCHMCMWDEWMCMCVCLWREGRSREDKTNQDIISRNYESNENLHL